MEAGKTRLPPPPADQLKKLESLQTAEQWLPLLLACESMSGRFLFWLDLHRLSAQAMDRLGALFMEAREAVISEVAGFVSRFPALVELSFSDGTPFASSATKAWLQEVVDARSAGSSAGSAQVDEEEAELAERFQEAKQLVTSGKVGEGLDLAIQLASRGADARTRFRSRLLVAQLALTGDKPEVAAPFFRALMEECERHGIDTWEPALASEVYGGLIASSGGTGSTELFDRLCLLDPAAALRLGR